MFVAQIFFGRVEVPFYDQLMNKGMHTITRSLVYT